MVGGFRIGSLSMSFYAVVAIILIIVGIIFFFFFLGFRGVCFDAWLFNGMNFSGALTRS